MQRALSGTWRHWRGDCHRSRYVWPTTAAHCFDSMHKSRIGPHHLESVKMGGMGKTLRETLFSFWGKEHFFFVVLIALVLFVYFCLFHLVVNRQSSLSTYSVTRAMSIAGTVEIVVSACVPRGQRPVCQLLVQSICLGCEQTGRASM